MKLIEQHLIEKFEERFTNEQLVEAGIPKLYMKMEAVKKVIKELEADRKKVMVLLGLQ